MLKSPVIKPKGILNPRLGEQKFQISRYLPSPDLNFFIERYWVIRWDLRGQAPHIQETLPYPCVNLVFERGNTRVFGIERGKFARLLEGQGQVFGIKFKPGAFYPFFKHPISYLTDQSIPFEEAFGLESAPFEDQIFGSDDSAAIEIVEQFLRERLPEEDENVSLIHHIIDLIDTDRTIIRVDDLSERLKLNKRLLQRLFSQYVGVSPKWVIQRWRLHEAAEQLAHCQDIDCTWLAQELGYFDQAHFIKDFKMIVGKTPAEYAKTAAHHWQ